MRYLIIGLGIYGTNLAKDLTDLGHEVIGADINSHRVDAIKDYIATAYIIDSTEEAAISVLPLKNVDLVVVAIGENFGASIKTVAILKKMGVSKIFARAIDSLHRAILEGLHVQRILNPEQYAAFALSNEMQLGSSVEILHIDHDTSVMRFEAPALFHSMPYSRIDTKALFGLRLIAASRPGSVTNLLGISATRYLPLDISASTAGSTSAGSTSAELVAPGDVFTCIGSADAYRALYKHLQRS